MNKFLLLILTFLFAACSPFPGASLQDPNTTSPVASSTPKPTIQLEPCRLGSTQAQCGTLRVYENRSARSGRTIDLRVAVIKASGENPAPDPIFYLAGGPGVAATEDAAKRPQFPYSLSKNHDLVFVDQRGTGGSNRVLIPSTAPDIEGLTPTEIDTQLNAWVKKVLSEMDMDPQYYTTSIAMDDLDDVRAALGYDKINLFGHSYGATAAQYYLRQHEEHVRSVVLSGGTLLDIPVLELFTKNGQRTLDLIFNRCQADPACHSAFPNLNTEFTELMARLDKQPVTQQITNPTTQQPDSIIYSADLFSEVIRVMTLDARYAAEVPILIHRASQENDWTGITNFYLTYGTADWTSQMMEHVIRCSEKWAAFDPDEVARLSEGSYLKVWYVKLAQMHAMACKITPRGITPEGTAPQPGSKVPILIINGEADPQAPPENMAGAKELWPNSIALIEPYQGHWLSDMAEIACRWNIQDQFTQTGSISGLDTSCLKRVQPPPFVMLEQLGIPTSTKVASTAIPTRIPTQASATVTPAASLTGKQKPIFKTSNGELTIDEARWVDEVNGVMPGPEERLLLILLSKPGQPKLDPGNFSLQDFDKALRNQSNGEVHISGEGNFYAICSMAGWIGNNREAFAMGFRIPKTAKTYQLFWPGNEPIDLHPDH